MSIKDIFNLGSTAETVSSNILRIANQCRNDVVKDAIISSLTGSPLKNDELIYGVNKQKRPPELFY